MFHRFEIISSDKPTIKPTLALSANFKEIYF
uniref:Uncharacterized protein n=1 Tax=Siphoviridae sp. ctmpG14 TaxID=2825654 RepID=A0A8S5PCU3_9CAUD|nr:MAG TPA: hypothetical protein [Siphoviridae sp. ctmpG14]